MDFWKRTPSDVWQGRDDSFNNPTAKRIFQTIPRAEVFTPEEYPGHIALMGFMCDEGVRLNKGRAGAFDAPNLIRKGIANLADHSAKVPLVDLGNLVFEGDVSLATLQEDFAKHIEACHQAKLPTLVFGGGHETAYPHAKGLFDAYPNARVGIINFDAHLDLRTADGPTSGTSFKQLAEHCAATSRDFNYLCVGASLPSNTKSLIQTAYDLGTKIIWDTECTKSNLEYLNTQLNTFIANVDIVYLTIDMDALPSYEMFAVSAPSSLGVSMRTYLSLAETIIHSSKLKAVDLVEYNPSLDRDMLGARTAARIAWHIYNHWSNTL